MAYRAKHIQDFIDKVTKEAEEASQKIYDANQAKLESLITNQVLDGQRLIMGNGTATITGSPDDDELRYDYASKFLSVLTNLQYETKFSTVDVDKRTIKFQH